MFVGICTSILTTFKKSLKNVTIYFNHVGFCYLLFQGIYLLILCGDIELNPGPKDTKYLSLCHWNLNSIAAHDFAKVSAIKAFNTTKNFDFICLSKSYLDSTISSVDKNLCLDGYKLIRANHPKNIKQGGACIVVFVTLITGDFNARCNRWWENDSNNTEGVSIDNLTSSYGLKQLIAEPTHIVPTSSSCIDLLFTSQSNMVVNSGVFPSIHQSCHHQIVFAKVNLKIFYPPPYTRRIWDSSNANHEAINNAIDGFDWEKAFSNVNVRASEIV